MAVTSGKTIPELRQESQLKDVRSNGSNGVPARAEDPIRGARQTMNELLATKVITQAAAELDVQAAEMDARKADAEIRRQQAMDALRNRGQDGASEMVGMLMAEVRETRDKMELLREGMTARELQLYQERLGAIQEELSRLRDREVPQGSTSAPGISGLKAQVEDAIALVDMLRPPEQARADALPVPPPDPISQQRLEVYALNKRMEHERWLRERDEEREERRLRLELEDRRERERLTAEREDRQARERIFTESMPELLKVATGFANAFLQRWSAAGPGAAAAGAEVPLAAAAQVAQLPEGVEAIRCQKCGATMYVRAQWGSAICQQCGADHQWEMAAPPPSADRPAPRVPALPSRPAPRGDEDPGGPMG